MFLIYLFLKKKKSGAHEILAKIEVVKESLSFSLFLQLDSQMS
jgi:hypothetical protein